MVCLAGVTAAGVIAQTPPKPVKAPKTDGPTKVKIPTPPETPEPVSRMSGVTEKAIAVDSSVNIKIPCILQARVTINGWQRDEVRVFVKNGSGVNFKVHEKDPKSGKPVWVVIARQIQGRSSTPESECISGERIDIEVPLKASVSMMGRETELRIDSIRKVDIKNIDGGVSIRNISGGIAASTYEGDVTVENSSGQISLDTSTGNILAYEVKPGQVGELFKAKTNNGTITLQKVDHRQIEAFSITGSLVFDGKFLAGGLYGFKTQNGSIKLALPQESSCRVSAWYGYGTIDSEIPMKIETETDSPAGKRIIAKIGDGQATVNLFTSNGQIVIVRQ